MSSREKSPYYGALQQVVDSLFADLTEEERIADMSGVPGARKVRRLDVILAAEAVDLPDDLREIVNLLPPSTFTRRRLCDQLNSAVAGGIHIALEGRPKGHRMKPSVALISGKRNDASFGMLLGMFSGILPGMPRLPHSA